MKIFAINTFGNFSTGKVATQIGKVAEARGHEFRLAFSRGNAPKGISSWKFGNKYEIAVHGALARLTDRQGFFSNHATKELINEIQRWQPDVIHLHNLHGYYLNYPMLFRYLASTDIPVVWTLHDCWPYTGHCCYYTEDQCYGWMTDGYCSNIRAYPKSLFINQSVRNFHEKNRDFHQIQNLTLVPISRWLQDEIRKSCLADIPNTLIQNGVDLDIFFPRQSNIREKLGVGSAKLVLGVANVWDRRKGLSDFLQLARRLESEVRVVLVGLTRAQIRMLPSNIVGIERTEDTNQLAELYSAADFFVNTSAEETFGLTTLEAMACGTSALVYNSTALPELINEGSGHVFDVHDVRSIGAFINHTEGLPLNLASVDVAQKYGYRTQYSKYVDLYEQMESNSKHGREAYRIKQGDVGEQY